ncbi:MAG: RNA 2',3'-cyclic phosphodiesterase [Calditrichaeota bacterium]|nr:MAG: RNA 2',3'-cyclic phosphodiesterase [Calditrichota bacterium]
MEETIRTFISVPLPAEVLSELRKMIDFFRPMGRNVKWVKPESIHLTLKFLGNVTTDQRDSVFSALEEIFRTPPPALSLIATGAGVFPNHRRPRVFWVGIEGDGFEELNILQKSIEMLLSEKGFPVEHRRFSPHLTVGRIRSGRKLDIPTETFTSYPFKPEEFTVDRVHIMKSELKPTSAVYTIQKSFELLKTEENLNL